MSVRDPHRPARAQTGRQVAAQRTARLHVQRLIDRLGRHPHLRFVGVILAQSAGDLLRGVPLGQLALNPFAQHLVGHQLRWLRARRPLMGQHMCRARPVPPGPVGVAGQLPRDRRGTATQPARYLTDRLTRRPGQGDLLSLGEGQVAPLQVAAATWTHPSGLAQPRETSMAMGARHRGRIGQELTGLPGSPERLIQLGDDLIGETHRHQHPHRIDQVLRPPREPGVRLAGRALIPTSTG